MSENNTCPDCAAEAVEAMEDMPMCRYRNPIPTCEHKCGSCGGHCPCGEQLEQILAALACQNQLLIDLLGAVNCLTAATLADHAPWQKIQNGT